jgi:hypothetical protein
MRTAVHTLLVVAGACVCQLASAQTQMPWQRDPPPRLIEDKFRIEINALTADFATTARVDQDLATLGTEFSAEDDFKMDASDVLITGEITLLPGESHLLRFTGLSTSRRGQTRLTREIAYDDDVYEVGEVVDSSLDFRLFGVTYGYRLLSTQRVELTPTLGLQVGEIKTNAVVRSRMTREPTGDVTPVPLIGADMRVDLAQRWAIEGRVQYVSVEVDSIKASVLDWRMALTWRTTPHFLIGLGYRAFNIDAESSDEDSAGVVDMKMTGPLLFMRASL